MIFYFFQTFPNFHFLSFFLSIFFVSRTNNYTFQEYYYDHLKIKIIYSLLLIFLLNLNLLFCFLHLYHLNKICHQVLFLFCLYYYLLIFYLFLYLSTLYLICPISYLNNLSYIQNILLLILLFLSILLLPYFQFCFYISEIFLIFLFIFLSNFLVGFL